MFWPIRPEKHLIQPEKQFSGALLEWCKNRGPIQRPYFYGISKNNSFVLMKVWWIGLNWNPVNYYKLLKHHEDINLYPIREMVYQICLNKEDMKIYVGEFVNKVSFSDGWIDLRQSSWSRWEWTELDINPYSHDCFDRIWDHFE